MRICVFCGSSCGKDEAYAQAARDLGRTLADRKIELIYGGGRVGLMGALADSVLAAGGVAIGVMPRSLVEKEIQHTELSQLHIVETMHERKTKMADLADGFIALPGGAGTLEEILEQWTWAQLGIHHKPCGFLNTKGYFDPLRTMIERMVMEGFLKPEHAAMVVFDTEAALMVDRFGEYIAPLPKWVTPSNNSMPGETVIRIVAALVHDAAGRVLLVRKRGTQAFMQPGGKLQASESHLTALEREIKEELDCSIDPAGAEYLGTFTAPAANETDRFVEAALYRVRLLGAANASAEIEEIVWLDPRETNHIELAPLTRTFVLPLAKSTIRLTQQRYEKDTREHRTE